MSARINTQGFRWMMLLVVCLLLCGNDWLQFRGPDSTSVSRQAKIPTNLAENIAWKVELPGKGPSSPIVVGDRVIVTCSSGSQEQNIFVACYDAASGDQLWQREFWAMGRSFCHPLSANAAPTPASDGKNVYAFFSSNDLVCLDLEGNLKWYRGLGVDHPKAGHDTGMSSSPVVADGVVVCQVENDSDSFVIGIDAETGATLWEKERVPEISWASPVVINSAAGANVVLQSQDRVSVLNMKTGNSIWELEGQVSTIPSATIKGNRMYLPINGTTVYQFSGDGEFNEVWKSERVAASTASLIADQERLYTIGRGGIVGCFDSAEGESQWKVRVGGSFWSTPVIAGNHMYLFAQEGNLTVLDVSENVDDNQRKVYEHEFADEIFLGSPAISGDAMYMRSDKHLFKFQGR